MTELDTKLRTILFHYGRNYTYADNAAIEAEALAAIKAAVAQYVVGEDEPKPDDAAPAYTNDWDSQNELRATQRKLLEGGE